MQIMRELQVRAGNQARLVRLGHTDLVVRARALPDRQFERRMVGRKVGCIGERRARVASFQIAMTTHTEHRIAAHKAQGPLVIGMTIRAPRTVEQLLLQARDLDVARRGRVALQTGVIAHVNEGYLVAFAAIAAEFLVCRGERAGVPRRIGRDRQFGGQRAQRQ